MLILFDIDATLLTTRRAGIEAMQLCGRELFHPEFDAGRVDYAGRLDPLIVADLLTSHGHEPTPENLGRFREGYHRHLTGVLATAGRARPCPGVPALLEALGRIEGLALGLLTGNFPETGRLKLRAAGIDPDQFTIFAWGCDSPHDPPSRDHLPPVALAQYSARFGREPGPPGATIIGDTPHDVACARAHGLRVLGVATGLFDAATLRGAGADLVVNDLSETDTIVDWLLARANPHVARENGAHVQQRT